MKPSVIVWDLETVPDLAGFAAANNLVGQRDADIRETLGNRFPKHIYHTIVCVSARSSLTGRANVARILSLFQVAVLIYIAV
jgi:hypothetical protein